MDPSTASAIQAFAAVSSVVVTLILAAITAYYAWATRGMLGEMRRAREATGAPKVLAYAEPGQHGPSLVVRNIGGGSAFHIKVVNRGPAELAIFGERRAIAVGERIVDDLFLAPQQQIATLAGITTMGSKAEDSPPTEVDLDWADEFGAVGRARSVVAFGSVMFAVNAGSLASVVSELRDLRREIASIRMKLK